MRIRSPKSVTIATSAVTGVSQINYDNADDYDRSRGDDQMYGDPVRMEQKGSGTIELLGGLVPNCYDQDIVAKYVEVTVANGAETVVERTATFKKCTINPGANVPAGSAGKVSAKFDFAYVTVA